MSTTDIQWTDRVWNPVRGCSRVSAGCENCYAMRQAHRFSNPAVQDPSGDRSLDKPAGPYHGLTVIRRGKVDWRGHARLAPEMLAQPLRWRKPSRIFVNSMSDLFHHSLSNEEIAAVFGVMAASPHHTFQVLTKRPQRMVEWFRWIERLECIPWTECHAAALALDNPEEEPIHRKSGGLDDRPWPLPNVWLGVSVEDQKTADERIPLLLRAPAAVRFVSAEPLLERVAFERSFFSGATERRYNWLNGKGIEFSADGGAGMWTSPHLDWVIVGGESGHGARDCEVSWIRNLVRQCSDANVPVFVKQLGACARDQDHFGAATKGIKDKAGGNPSEWPDDLRVRQFPKGAA